jgi:nucleoid-associated protein YgaU
MGKFEKIVVLAVLFLVTLILVVSMNTGELEGVPHAAVGGGEPLMSEPILEIEADEAEGVMELVEADPALASFDPSSALLSGQIEAVAVDEAPAVVEAAFTEAEVVKPDPELPEGALLITLDGLSETPEPGTYWHTCAEGDTYKSLATRYYGDASFYALLQHVNDAWGSAPVGETVIIPSYDVRSKRRGTRGRIVDMKPVGGGVSYRVLEGDNLWKISVKHYGKGSKNLEIYEANRDVLKTPDALRPGMLIQIPE